MVNRLVSVGDDLTLPDYINVADENLPARLDAGALNATIGDQIEVAATDPLGVLAAKFAARRNSVYGNRTVFDGDSITINQITALGGVGQDRAQSWTTELAGRSMGAIDYVRNAAVSGNTSAQRLAAFDTAVAPYSPETVIYTIGTNDIGQSVSMASWLANMDAYLAKCESIGARLIVGAIWPTDAAVPAGRGATTRAWNDALYAWAHTNGLDIIPWDRLANPVTGGWPTGWSTDNLHPTMLDSYAQIGTFAWEFLKSKFGPPVVRRAVSIGDGLLANPFFTELGAALAVPTISAGTPTVGTGTLPAGDYSYKMTNRSLWGEGLPSAERLVTLASPGKIDLTFNVTTGTRQKRLYRKGPGDTTWKLLAKVGAVTTTYTDDGSVPLAAPTVPTVDRTAIPTGLINSNATSFLHDIDSFGPFLFTEAGVRGNVLRLTRYESGTTDFVDRMEADVTAGDVVEFNCLARSSGQAYGQIVLRFRTAASADAGQIVVGKGVMSGGFRLLRARVTVPAGAVRVFVSFEGDDTSDYLDIAELRLARV